MRIRSLLVCAASITLLALTVYAAEEVKLDGVKCIMNPKAAAKAGTEVDYKGGKVFFCCMNCPKKFDATKNAVAANHQLVATKQAKQEKCPLTGRPLNAEQKLTINGAEVAFCCPNCKGKIGDSSGEDQVKAVFSNEAFEKAGFKVTKK
jgi:YHS domain-containing protein